MGGEAVGGLRPDPGAGTKAGAWAGVCAQCGVLAKCRGSLGLGWVPEEGFDGAILATVPFSSTARSSGSRSGHGRSYSLQKLVMKGTATLRSVTPAAPSSLRSSASQSLL